MWTWVTTEPLVIMAQWRKKKALETHLTRGKQRSGNRLLPATCKLRRSYTVHMQPSIGQRPRKVWRTSQSVGVRCLVNIFGLGRETEQLFPLCGQHGRDTVNCFRTKHQVNQRKARPHILGKVLSTLVDMQHVHNDDRHHKCSGCSCTFSTCWCQNRESRNTDTQKKIDGNGQQNVVPFTWIKK